MPEIEEELNFQVNTDNVTCKLVNNDEVITINRAGLDKNQAATLAWLINQTNKTLKIEMKF